MSWPVSTRNSQQFIHAFASQLHACVAAILNCSQPLRLQTAAFIGLLCQHPEQHVWSVRGNHDDAALAAWRQLQQGVPPADPMLQWVGQLQPQDVNFLAQLPFSLTIEG